MIKQITLLVTLAAVVSALFLVRANAQSDVVINELLWSGTEASANDEYIELSGPPGTDLSGWTLAATDGSPSISLTGVISTTGFYLLERADDTTVSNVTADQLYTGALNNDGELLELRDAANTLVDTVDASGGWLAGSNAPRAAMERQADDSFSTNDCLETSGALDALGAVICGTPGATNASANQAPTDTKIFLPIVILSD